MFNFTSLCNISNLPPSDDYNRVLLKLDEGRSRESDPDEDDEEESSDEEDEDSTKYINASHIDVRYFTGTFSLFTIFLQKTLTLTGQRLQRFV